MRLASLGKHALIFSFFAISRRVSSLVRFLLCSGKEEMNKISAITTSGIANPRGQKDETWKFLIVILSSVICHDYEMAALIPKAPAKAVARAMTNFRINPMVSFVFDFSIRYIF